MDICFLFGHQNIKNTKTYKLRGLIKYKLNIYIKYAIQQGYRTFSICELGDFFTFAYEILEEYKKTFPLQILVCNVDYILKDSNEDALNYEAILNNIQREAYSRKSLAEVYKRLIDESSLIICYSDFFLPNGVVQNCEQYARKNGKDLQNILSVQEYLQLHKIFIEEFKKA